MSPVRLRLKELRQAAHLTQAQLAKKVGVRQATINDLENDKSRRIELDLLERLAAALGVEPGALLIREKKGMA